MPTPTVAESLKYASVQMAAEAFLVFNDGTVKLGTDYTKALTDGNGHTSKFLDEPAKDFAAQWTVINQKINTSSGFSGTLFKNKDTGECVISFRSTEFIDDATRDCFATNNLEIFDTGWAWGQMADMEAWYASVKSQITGPLSVTGYSLGAHLATAFNMLHAGEIDKVVTLNGAGVGEIDSGYDLKGLLNDFTRLKNDPTQVANRIFDPALRAKYLDLAGRTYATQVDVDRAKTELLQFYPGAHGLPPEAIMIWNELDKIGEIIADSLYVSTLTAGGNGPDAGTHPDAVPVAKMVAANLNYRMAVHLVSEHTDGADYIREGLHGLTGKIIESYPGLSPQYDLMGIGNPSMVSNSQIHYGEDIKIFIEDQPSARGTAVTDAWSFKNGLKLLQNHFNENDFGDTHSLVLIVDSLSVQNTILQLVPDALRADATKTIQSVLQAASNLQADTVTPSQGKAEGDVLENMLNALADLMLGPGNYTRLKGSPDGNTWAKNTNQIENNTQGYTGRDDFYKVLSQITIKPAYTGNLGKFSLVVPGPDLASKARTDFGAFAALYSLSPFALLAGTADTGAYQAAWGDIYQAWNADKALTKEELKEGKAAYSDQWLADRALMSRAIVDRNLQNNAGLSPRAEGLYTYNFTALQFNADGTDFRIDKVGKGVPIPIQIVFGSKDGDTITGGEHAGDRLYGGAGNDTINGKGGNDYIEGNEDIDTLDGDIGNDTILGGIGADILTGGKGADLLKGGAGVDTYKYQSGDGTDTIIDSDGQGKIEVNGEKLKLGHKIDGQNNVWQSEDNKFLYVLNKEQDQSNTLSIVSKDATVGIKIIVKNFKDGDLSIDLEDEQEDTLDTGIVVHGDKMPAIWPGYSTDFNGNINGSIASPGFQDRLYGKYLGAYTGNDLGDDKLYGYGGNDILTSEQGDDWLDGGEGVDILAAGGGEDTLYGGAGNDYLYGGGNYGSQSPQWSQFTPPPGKTVVASGWNWAFYEEPFQSDDGQWSTRIVLGGIEGGQFSDDITDFLYGGAGDDQLEGGWGLITNRRYAEGPRL